MIFAIANTLLAITVTVPETAHVRGQELHVSSIVRIEGADVPEKARIDALTLGYTPSPGFGRVITRDEIAQKIRAALPNQTVSVIGAERCQVAVETEVIRGETLRANAMQALRDATAGLDATVSDATPLQDLIVPRAESKLEIRATADNRNLRSGLAQVAVQIWIDGAPYQTVQAPLTLEMFEKVPVLVVDVRRGEALSASVVELKRQRIDATLQGAPLAWAAVSGATALRDLRIGTVVTDRDVQRTQLVKRGDVVQIQVRKGPVVARSTAIASQDGFLGDKVRVTTTDAKRELTAVVTGRASVEVDLGEMR
ncbi:MAG: flagellar basal body P-ring formation chaperone FlgA [Planctomycetota bacterium]|nr:flagellar basal body P-ring formation chaperone FlgA [Planctomycetota bacterium]